MSGGPNAPRKFPQVTLQNCPHVWKLGEEEYRPELEGILQGFTDFSVDDEAAEDHCNSIRAIFDDSVDGEDLAACLAWIIVDGDNVQLVKKVLGLGVHPDLEDRSGQRPSHACGFWGHKECAKALSACRIDLLAKNDLHETPLATARSEVEKVRLLFGEDPVMFRSAAEECMKNHLQVAELWEKTAANGYPSVAQLAHDKKWWAVKNLCRRRVVPDAEKPLRFRGRTAIAWAEHYGEQSLANEIRYLWTSPPPSWKGCVKNVVADEVSKSGMQETPVDSGRESEPDVASGLAVLQEGLTLCVSRFAEEIGSLKEEMAAIKLSMEKKQEKTEERMEKRMASLEAKLAEMSVAVKGASSPGPPADVGNSPRSVASSASEEKEKNHPPSPSIIDELEKLLNKFKQAS